MNFYSYEPFINFESNLALFEEHNELDTYTNYFSNDNQLATTILLPSFDKANTLINQSFVNKNVLTNELQTHKNSYETESNEQPLFYSSLTEQKMSPIWLNNDLQTQPKTDFETQNQMFSLVQPTNEPLLNFSNDDLDLPSNESPKPFQMEKYETENVQLDFNNKHNNNNNNKNKNKNNNNNNKIGNLNQNGSLNNQNQEIGFDFLNYSNEISNLLPQSLTKDKMVFSEDNNLNSKAQRKRLYEENEDEIKKAAKSKMKRTTKVQTPTVDAKKIRRKTTNRKERKEPKIRTTKPSSKKTKSTNITNKTSNNSILRHRRKKKSQKKKKNQEFEVNSIIIPTEKGKRVKIIKRKKPTRSSRLKTSEYGKKLFESWFKKHLNKPEGPYPDKNTRKMMSEKTGIPELQVTRWFGQRRRLQRMLCEKNNFTKPYWID
ncbi:hypothetical protein M0812_14968 [Anaeramoeba flamelloides]|uniref:Homeobox domain-containing protein n=1 Tax=Anaeramoeba flamelloides TaxID=1746091 RepID=A0AAV7ZA81_9EUKA|nr:hypothetical protein M0812_14968 [Anaeramoeba flamelloides]